MDGKGTIVGVTDTRFLCSREARVEKVFPLHFSDVMLQCGNVCSSSSSQRESSVAIICEGFFTCFHDTSFVKSMRYLKFKGLRLDASRCICSDNVKPLGGFTFCKLGLYKTNLKRPKSVKPTQ